MRLLTALLAATLPLAAGQMVQLLPAGEFAARDGRPGAGKSWRLSDADGVTLAADVNRIAQTNPLVIDYEHQTLHAAANGRPAPAAGWIQRVQWQAGKGLMADVAWTPAALAAIEAGEYRYISPVITFDEATGRVTSLALAAITNHPALLGMDAVVAQLNTQLPPQQETRVTLIEALIAKLGLPPGTSEADLTAAVGALKASADAAKARPAVPAALVAELGLQATADETAALSAVKALKTGDQSANELIVALTAQVAQLTAQGQQAELTAVVDGAIAASKFAPAHRDWLVAQGQRDLAALRSLVDSAPAIPGLAGQKPGAGGGDGGSTAALTASQALIAKQLGISEADYAKQLAARAA